VLPPEVNEFAGDWPLPNFDYASTRATMNSTINPSNVNDLDVAWSFGINATGPFGGASSNPIIMGDTVYFQDLNASVFALDFQSGDLIWAQRYENASVTGPNGPAVGWGKVFAVKDPFTAAALDADSGEEIWSTRLVDVANVPDGPIGEGIDIQPQVFDDMLFVSTVPGRGDVFYQSGAVGIISALDQETGEVVWNFSTVDDPESIRGNPDVNSGGGCWYTPSIDPDRGTIYWGVANPAPFAGTQEYPNGTSRPGPNLYTNSMLSLDYMTGELQWFSQILPHDLFDHDFQAPPILTSANISGEEQDIVIGAGKMGRVYAFNRDTGAILWVALVGMHRNDQLAALPPDEVTTVYPGALGGVETPMAYADGVVYVPYVDLYTNWTPESSLSVGVPGAISPEIQPFDEGTGGLAAIETDTGKVLWEQNLDSINVGAATVVNDLVFTATFDGTIYAFNRTSGEQVWNYTAPAGINAWPAVAGDTIVWPAGVGNASAMIALRPEGAANVTPTPTPEENVTPAPAATPAAPEQATIDLVAETIAFDTDSITVPACAQVTISFENRDIGILHNFAVYETSAAQNAIFVGEIIAGPQNITYTYTFTAPEQPGTYFFRCDVHPTAMTGDFVVE